MVKDLQNYFNCELLVSFGASRLNWNKNFNRSFLNRRVDLDQSAEQSADRLAQFKPRIIFVYESNFKKQQVELIEISCLKLNWMIK